MEKTTKMLLLVIMMMSMGEAMVDMEDIAKQLRIEMEDMKKDLLTTKEDLKGKDVSIEQMEREISITKEDLLTTKEDLFTTKEDLKTKDASIKYLETEVSSLRNPPFTFACGAHYSWIKTSYPPTSATIYYTKLLYSSTNVDGPHGLDISTGVFTAGYPGTYIATWSLATGEFGVGDHAVNIYLRKNGATIRESKFETVYQGSSGKVHNQGGRTLVLHLGRGETLDLNCEDCHGAIGYISFCVSLSQADVE